MIWETGIDNPCLLEWVLPSYLTNFEKSYDGYYCKGSEYVCYLKVFSFVKFLFNFKVNK